MSLSSIEYAIQSNDQIAVSEYIKEKIRMNNLSIEDCEKLIQKCVRYDRFELFKLCVSVVDKDVMQNTITNPESSRGFYRNTIMPILNSDYIEYIEWLYTTYGNPKLLVDILLHANIYLHNKSVKFAIENIRRETFDTICVECVTNIINKGHLPILQTIFPYVTLDTSRSWAFLETCLNSNIIHTDVLSFLVENGCLHNIPDDKLIEIALRRKRIDIINYFIKCGVVISFDFILTCIEMGDIECFSFFFSILSNTIKSDTDLQVECIKYVSHAGQFIFFRIFVSDIFDGNVERFIVWCKENSMFIWMTFSFARWAYKIDLDTCDGWWRHFWFTFDKECELTRRTADFKEKIKTKREEIRCREQYTEKEHYSLSDDVIRYCVNTYY